MHEEFPGLFDPECFRTMGLMYRFTVRLLRGSDGHDDEMSAYF